MTDRIPLDAMTSDQLDQLYDDLDRLRAQLADMTSDRDRWKWYRDDAERRVRVQRERAERAEAAIARVLEVALWIRRNYPGLHHVHDRITAALDRPAPSAAVESASCSCSDGYKCPHRCWHCGAARAASCEPWCHIRPFDKPTPAATEATEDPIIRARLATALREHGMVHLSDRVPADEYDCCADAAITALRQHRGESCSPAARETEPNNPHHYLSTGCFHGDHDYCKAMTGLNGAKRPAECKQCGAKCVCPCHRERQP